MENKLNPTYKNSILANENQTNKVAGNSEPILKPVIEELESKVLLLNTKQTNSIGFKKYFKEADPITGRIKMTIDSGSGELLIDNFDKKYKEPDFQKILSNSTIKIFRYIVLKITEQNSKKKIVPGTLIEVSINSTEYQRFTGRKDYNNASKLIKKDLDNL